MPGEAGLDRRADRLGQRLRRQRLLGGRPRIAVGEGDRRRSAVGHRRRQSQSGSGRARPRVRSGALGRGQVTVREPIAGHQLVEVRPPRVRERMERVAAGSVERLGRAGRFSGVDARDRRVPRRRARRSRSGPPAVARSRLSSAVAIATWMSPAGSATNARQNSAQASACGFPDRRAGFDGGVEKLGGLGQPSEHAPRHAESRVDSREQLVLSGCASDAAARVRRAGRPRRSGRGRSPRLRDPRRRRAGGRAASSDRAVDQRRGLGSHRLPAFGVAAPCQCAGGDRQATRAISSRITEGSQRRLRLEPPTPGRRCTAGGTPRRVRARS